jgi:hypothetical protein
LEYTVTGPGVVQDSMGGVFKPGDGMVFVIVPLTITNQSDSTLIMGSNTLVRATDGTTFTRSPSSEVLYKMPDGSTNQLNSQIWNPRETKSGVYIFQVDATKVSGLHLVLSPTSDSPVAIDLKIS